MKLFLLFLLAGCAVKCDDSNYYVIQMPEHDTSSRLQVYWNVPTMQCASKKIPFKDLERFGILQNDGDSFRGETIAIMYDPGIFPALFRNESSGQLRFRNGGVPQEGDLELHIKSFKNVLEQSIPDAGFSGIGIIDFESWRPILRQNFGDTLPYKAVSYEIEKKNHWWWPQSWIQSEAKLRFEEAAREFMQTTISIAKQMRPKARWGYYGFPYCFNMATNNMKESCANNVDVENDQIDWLWMESTALFPSVYSAASLGGGGGARLAALVAGRVREAARLRRPHAPILPYFWYRYKDGGFLSQEDLQAVLQTFNESEASGFIIWGSSNDVNTVDKCKQLLNYLETVMGPAIAKYTLKNVIKNEVMNDENTFSNDSKINDVMNTTSSIINDSAVVNDVNDSTMIASQNSIDSTTKAMDINGDECDDVSTKSMQKCAEKVTEENEKTKNDENITVLKKLNESVLIDLIINTLLNNLSKEHETLLVKEADNIHKNNEDITTEIETTIIDNTPTEITLNYDLDTSTHLVDNFDSNLNKTIKKTRPKFSESLSGTTVSVPDNYYLETSSSNTDETSNFESSSTNINKGTHEITENVYFGDVTTDLIDKHDLETSNHSYNDLTQRLNNKEHQESTHSLLSNIFDETTTEITNKNDSSYLRTDELLEIKDSKKGEQFTKYLDNFPDEIFTPTTENYDDVTVKMNNLYSNRNTLLNLNNFGNLWADVENNFSTMSTREESVANSNISTENINNLETTENAQEKTPLVADFLNFHHIEGVNQSNNGLYNKTVLDEIKANSENFTDIVESTEIIEPSIKFKKEKIKNPVPRSTNENFGFETDIPLESSTNQVLVRIV